MDDKNLRVIATARTEKAINEAVLQGYWPLVKPVIPSPEIKVKYAVLQDKVTGQISVIHDYRAKGYTHDFKTTGLIDGFGDSDAIISTSNQDSPITTVIKFTYYYPHHFESPYAAYLIPKDLEVNETVFIEDLIEDVVGSRWNQGDTYRLKSCTAVWDGKDFIVSHNLLNQTSEFIG